MELVVVLVPRPDLLATGVKRVGVQFLLHVGAAKRIGKIFSLDVSV